MKKVLLILMSVVATIVALASSQMYVITKNGDAVRFPSDEVDSIGFVEPIETKVIDYGNIPNEIKTLYDTVTVFDTLTVRDTMHSTVIDTVIVFDTVTIYDKVLVYDTISVFDTVVVYDTVKVVEPEKEFTAVPAEQTGLLFIYDNVTMTAIVANQGGGRITEAKIPSQVLHDCKVYDVTEIGEHAFYSCKKLASIEIPNSVTKIGNEAFAWCDSLTSIVIPSTVAEIGDDAFKDCSYLTSIIVDKGNKIYDSRENCNAIIETASNTLIFGCTRTMIPSTVTKIGYEAFWGCDSLTSIEIPNSVTEIRNSAFEYTGLTSIVIPNSVTTIGEMAFYGCDSLTSIVIPNSVTTIGEMAFDGCENLSNIEIPYSVIEIGSGAFSRCTSLKTARVPVSLKGKVEYAFPETCMIEWYDESGYAYVDLGLPSGLKWATMNVGATMPEQYGDYFDWDDRLIPEMFDRDYGDKVFELIDLATKKWGDGWRMPTHTEWEELIANCTWEWTQIGNENGYKVQSKVNKNWIFLPATGYRLGESIDDGFAGYYWSSTVYDAYEGDTYYLYFNSSTKITRNGTSRTSSRTIRPVTK